MGREELVVHRDPLRQLPAGHRTRPSSKGGRWDLEAVNSVCKGTDQQEQDPSGLSPLG